MAAFIDETSLLTLLPATYREADADGSLQALFAAVDNIWSSMVTSMENFDSAVLIPDPSMLDNWLTHRGNPFTFPMTDDQKRLLVDGLFRIYRLRGSKDGMLKAINYILGLDCTVQYDFEYCWRLGVSHLGVDTILMSNEKPTARLFVAGQLDNDTLYALQTIVEFMKPHWLDIRIVGGAIVGPRTITLGASYTAKVLPVTGAVSYTWSIQNGTILSGQGTNQITFEGTAVGLVVLGISVSAFSTIITNTLNISAYLPLTGLSLVLGSGSPDSVYQYAGTFNAFANLSMPVYKVEWSAANLNIKTFSQSSVTFDVGQSGISAQLIATVTDATGAILVVTQDIKVVPYTSDASYIVTNVLAPDSYIDFELELGWEYHLTHMSANCPTMLRIYNTAADRLADANRDTSTDALSTTSIVYEGATSPIKLSFDLPDLYIGRNGDTPRTKVAYCRIFNMDTVSQSPTVTVTRTETRTNGTF